MIEVNGRAYKIQKHLHRFVLEIKDDPKYKDSFTATHVLKDMHLRQQEDDDFPDYKSIRDLFNHTADAQILQDNLFEEIEGNKGVYRLKIDFFF